MDVNLTMPSKSKIYKWYYVSTFIGTVFHELAHKQFAMNRGLDIIEVSYFSLEGGTLGHVNTSPPRTYTDVFVVSFAPFMFNTVTAMAVITTIATYIEFAPTIYAMKPIAITILCGWFSISLLLHSFPSSVDTNNILSAAETMWDRTRINILHKTRKKISDAHIAVRVILSPISAGIISLHIAIFAVFRLKIVITLPICLILKGFNRTKKYGSHYLFTVGIILLTVTQIQPHVVEAYEIVRNFYY